MSPTTHLNSLIQHLASVTAKQTDQLLQEQLGIGSSQYRILVALEQSPYIQQKELAGMLGQTEASISRQIGLLNQKGLVATRLDKANKRKHMSALTPIGMQLVESATAIIRRNIGPEYASLGDKQLQQLLQNLDALHAIICQSGKLGACNQVSAT